MRAGRYGPYVTEAVDGDGKPRTASLFRSMSPETVTLEQALPLLEARSARGGGNMTPAAGWKSCRKARIISATRSN